MADNKPAPATPNDALAASLRELADAMSRQTDALKAAMMANTQATADMADRFVDAMTRMLAQATAASMSSSGKELAIAGDTPRAVQALGGLEGDVLVLDPSAVVAIEPETNPHNNKLGSRVHFYGGGSTRVAESPGEVAHVLGFH